MEGTLNPKTAESWARLCVEIVQFSRNAAASAFKSRVDALLRIPVQTTGAVVPAPCLVHKS